MDQKISLIFLGIILIILILLYKSSVNRKKLINEKLALPFPEKWKSTLLEKNLFYIKLNYNDRALFEERIQRFLSTKNIEGIDTKIDDTIRLLVASSAIIPTFSFPEYNYPNVTSILIYPNSFDENFQTKRFAGHKEFILGMVGNRFMNGTVILSKPDLIDAFDGKYNNNNVGIHEFVHLLDEEDGVIDGIPEALLEKRFVGPWLHEIKKEMKNIESGNSDIHPYALTNNAEFLAVVSEYFFDNPNVFENKHPELYRFLSSIYNLG